MSRMLDSRAKRIAVGTMALIILAPACAGFAFKLGEFFKTLTSEAGGDFTLVPISNYVLVALGFVCLLVWAVANGMFRDVEGPKYTMLDRERELDRLQGREWSE